MFDEYNFAYQKFLMRVFDSRERDLFFRLETEKLVRIIIYWDVRDSKAFHCMIGYEITSPSSAAMRNRTSYSNIDMRKAFSDSW